MLFVAGAPSVVIRLRSRSRRLGSEPFLDTDRLTVRLVSNEDIFLFKAIAGRDGDIEDMNMLVQAGLDYDVVRDELEASIQMADSPSVTCLSNSSCHVR